MACCGELSVGVEDIFLGKADLNKLKVSFDADGAEVELEVLLICSIEKFLVLINISVFPQSFLPGGAMNNTLSTQSAHTYTRSRGFLTPSLKIVTVIRYF